MSNQTTDVDAIIEAVEAEAKDMVASDGPPKITANTANVTLETFEYTKPNPITKPFSINHVEYNNDADLPTTGRFPTQTKKTVSTFSFSFSEGFKFTSKSTLKVGVPEVGDATEELDFEVDFSATQTVTKTTEQSWTYAEEFGVPARAKICADLIIDQNSYDPEFSGTVILTGDVKAHASSNKHGEHNESDAQVSIPGWLYANKDKYPHIEFKNFEKRPGPGGTTSPEMPLEAVIPVSGKFTGVSGSNMRIEIHQKKVDEPCTPPCPKAPTLVD